MYKLVQSNAAGAGFGLQQGPHSLTAGPSLLLEKRSEDLTGQMNWVTAAERIDPRVRKWVNEQKLDFDRYVYVLVVPLGADESWEQTSNGDAFERSMLAPENPEWGHASFMHHAQAFKNHRNTDPTIGFGDVPFTCYNTAADRVEGVWRLDREKAARVGALDVVSRIAREGAAEISMGCRVPFDRCSLCGNQAKTVREYCEHVRVPGFGHIDDLGRLMRVFNPWPKFFDLSDVRVPAAPEAHVLMLISPELAKAVQTKTSSGARFIVPSSILAAERWGTSDAGLLVPAHYKASSAADAVKLSDIIKRAPVLDAQIIRPLQEQEPVLSEELLKDSGAESVHLPQALSTLAGLGIVCSPAELCRVISACTGEQYATPTTAQINAQWSSASDAHPHVQSGFFSPTVADGLKRIVPDRSILYPHLCSRIARFEVGSGNRGGGPDLRVSLELSASPEMEHIARYIASYLRTMSVRLGKMLAEILAMYPSHATQCLGAGILTAPSRSGKATAMDDFPAEVAFPSAYILANAGRAANPEDLRRSIDALHYPGIEHLFGGLLAP